MDQKPILVTGATGYIGGRLVPLLLKGGYKVRAMARSLEKLKGRPWANNPNIELFQADLHDFNSLQASTSGCSAAYYLVHSMNPQHKNFVDADRQAAKNFLKAAEQSKLDRIIYLGGLGWDQPNASSHLKSRHEVGNILQSGKIAVTRFRAAQILGSGSACFEMLRYLFERLPLFVIPQSFIETKLQPIAIRNVLVYLTECLKIEKTIGQTFEIGGPDILTYRQLFQICAEEKGLKDPIFINAPKFELGRRLGLSLVKWILPLPTSISEPLLEGLAVQVTIKDDRITQIIPQELLTCREALSRAIQADILNLVETRWTDAGELSPPEWLTVGDAPYSGGTLFQTGYKIMVKGSPEIIWPVIRKIGGEKGWYYGDLVWKIRGWVDRFAGGYGLWRGRRHPEELWVGEVLDFWRVLDIKPPFRLHLLSEKKQPGESTMNIDLVPAGTSTELRIKTQFRPNHLSGFLYWYLFLPIRNQLFCGMLNEIVKNAGLTADLGPAKLAANMD